MITVVFDTNIFISAFEFGGVPRDAFLLASAGLFDIRTSKPLLDELSRVLRDRFEYSGEEVTEIRWYFLGERSLYHLIELSPFAANPHETKGQTDLLPSVRTAVRTP